MSIEKIENQIPLDEIKKIECGILDYIDKTCNENGLKYYLAFQPR
jgi:phosphorylcholine metabolism protein LicD